MTKAESCLWKYVLKAKKMKGYAFRRQRPVFNYIADFMCKDLLLIIEVDGITHQWEKTIENDITKQQELEQAGFTVLRFEDEEVLQNINNVIQTIEFTIEKLEESTPNPRPRGTRKQGISQRGSKVLLDGKIIDPSELSFGIFQRGFQYGDGLFETIHVKNGEVLFLPYHLKRLKEGLKTLDIQWPPILGKNLLENSIRSLLESNELKDQARLRLSVWRSPGGLYAPTDNQAHVLLTADVFTPPPTIHHKVSFSQQVTLYPGPTSKFKTISAIPYVLAGIEKSKRSLDDLILLDHLGHVSECSMSNLFWIKNGLFYTPSLNTGCIAGVRRQHILDTLKNHDIPFREVKAGKEALLQADYIFSCNVAGIYRIGNIDDHHFEIKFPDKWIKLLG